MSTALKTFLIVLVIILSLFIVPMVFGWGMMGGGMMGSGRGGGGPLWWGISWMLGIIFFAAVVAGVVWLITSIVRTGTTTGRVEDNALEILKKRYARGEINKQEFEEKKKDLMQ